MQLNIIYEDRDVLVCFKPVGTATQINKISQQDMVSLIKNYLSKQNPGKTPYVGVIHRLDQPVSGLLVFAKNPQAAASLSMQIQDGSANKDYIAFCSGLLEEKQGTLIHYIQKDPVTKTAKIIREEEYKNTVGNFVIDEEEKQEIISYKKAILSYEVEREFKDSSIIRVHLETGRFHQIRAQFSFVGNALLGDTKYGSAISKQISMEKRIKTAALCAYCLELKHPTTGKTMKFVLEDKFLPRWYQFVEA